MSTTATRANTANVLTAAISEDVRASHITVITELGRAVATLTSASDIADAVRAAMPADYDWSAKQGKSTAVTVAVHTWATGTDDSAAWPAITRAETKAEREAREETKAEREAREAGQPVPVKRIRTHYAVGVDAVAKHLRPAKDAKATDWLTLFATAAKNAEDNGHTLAEMVARLLETVGEADSRDAAIATAAQSAMTLMA